MAMITYTMYKFGELTSSNLRVCDVKRSEFVKENANLTPIQVVPPDEF